MADVRILLGSLTVLYTEQYYGYRGPAGAMVLECPQAGWGLTRNVWGDISIPFLEERMLQI